MSLPTGGLNLWQIKIVRYVKAGVSFTPVCLRENPITVGLFPAGA
jgi:hypothetical protein